MPGHWTDEERAYEDERNRQFFEQFKRPNENYERMSASDKDEYNARKISERREIMNKLRPKYNRYLGR